MRAHCCGADAANASIVLLLSLRNILDPLLAALLNTSDIEASAAAVAAAAADFVSLRCCACMQLPAREQDHPDQGNE